MKEKTEKPSVPKLRTSWVPIPVAVIIAVLGVCFIAFSSIIEYLAYAIGIFVIIGAAALGTATIMGKKYDFLFFFKLVFAVCCIATGVLAILFNEYSAGVICIVFSSAVAIDGSVKLGTAIQSKQYSVRGKTVAAVIAILTIAVALAMVRFTPYDITDANIKKCSVIIGLSFILDAIGNFIIPFLKMGINRRIVKKIVDDISVDPAGALIAVIPNAEKETEDTEKEEPEALGSTENDETCEQHKSAEDENSELNDECAPVQNSDSNDECNHEGNECL